MVLALAEDPLDAEPSSQHPGIDLQGMRPTGAWTLGRPAGLGCRSEACRMRQASVKLSQVVKADLGLLHCRQSGRAHIIAQIAQQTISQARARDMHSLAVHCAQRVRKRHIGELQHRG